jgi:tetratricopeptide (TPR) repeat protein
VDAAPIVPAQALALSDAVAEKKVVTHDLSGISLDLAAPNDPVAPAKIATRSKKDLPKDQSKDVAKDQQKDQPTKDAQKDQPVVALTKDKQKLLEARTEAETHPEDAHALQAWANAAFRAGDYREARRASEAWSLRDGSPEPRIFLAEVLDATGKRADARAVLEEVLDLHPDSTEARRLHAHYGAPLPSLDSGSRKSIAHR